MRPDNDNQPKPRSIDGVSLPRVVPTPQPVRQPELRYDHELPAPKPHELLGEHALQNTILPPPGPQPQPQSPAELTLDSLGDSGAKPKKKKSLVKKLFIG
ncbi:MAG: hypothetical protein EOO17_02875 [Chloroflexi bacterium]|nr:MAG: hypothetical protein EOO17_02875 [Chloroflexota bacterium]